MKELITIVVPIYKVEKYLERCIESVLKQTYKEMEIILVNDGSPDRCGEICDNYKKKDKRIKVIHKINGGLSDARNTGIENSTGKYISFLDSDDWIDEIYIERLYFLIKNSNADISVVNYLKSYDENIKVDLLKEEIQELTNIQAIRKMYDKNTKIQMIVTWGKLFKRDLFENIIFPYGKVHEDEYTTYKLYYISKKVVISSKILLFYWQREDSIIGSDFNINYNSDAYCAFEEKLRFFKIRNLHELYDMTCREMFTYFIQSSKKIRKSKININLKARRLKLEELKKNLRKSRQKIHFKIFYELYFCLY